MRRVLSFIRPYLLFVILAIALLFIQANADLALPDYMSKIVNIGIQQAGVEDALPQAMGVSALDKLSLFLSAEEKAALLSAYDFFPASSPERAKADARYPKAASEGLYVLRNITAEERKALAEIAGKALATVSLVEKGASDPKAASAIMGGGGFALPPGVDPMALLSSLPEDRRAGIVSAITGKIASLDPLILSQMGVSAVSAEYERLGADVSAMQTSYILGVGGMMLLLTLLSVSATVMVGFLGARTAAGTVRDIRGALFRRVESFSLAEFDTFSTSSLITRSTNDLTQIQMMIMMGLRMFFYAPIIGIGGVIRATSKASQMWWIIALAVGILICIIAGVFIIAVPRFKSIQKLVDRLNRVVRENLSGMMVIRAFSRQKLEEKRFDAANKSLTDTMLYVTRVMVILMPLIMLIMNLVSLLILWNGAHEVAASKIRVGDMMAFLQYSMQIFFAFIMMSMMFIMLPRAAVSAERVAEVLKTEPSIVDKPDSKPLPKKVSGRIEFKNVSFRYPGAKEDVLHGISFIADPGKTTAIIGTTGAGKTTLVSLIPRFYEATAGEVLLDGLDVRELTQADLRSSIGFVPQKSVLFSGSIRSNLLYAKEDAADADMEEALETAQAKDFVFSWEKGLDSEISQGGANVSGGQRQRLAIARALMKRAPVYIFDDSFSALDYKTDMKLRKALREKSAGSTVLLVTQRVAAIMHADRILVLDEGRLVGSGTHRELMEACDVYRDIAESQLKQEELV